MRHAGGQSLNSLGKILSILNKKPLTVPLPDPESLERKNPRVQLDLWPPARV